MAHGAVCQTDMNTIMSSAGFVLSGWLDEGTPQTDDGSPTYDVEGGARGRLMGIKQVFGEMNICAAMLLAFVLF